MIQFNGRSICAHCRCKWPCLAVHSEIYERIYGNNERSTYDLP